MQLKKNYSAFLQSKVWNLNDVVGNKNCKRYAGRPVGNSPELMPLDNSLNNDLQMSHRYHCIVTAHLPDTDERKFSLSTPLRIARGIKKYGKTSTVHLTPNAWYRMCT